MVHGLLDRLGLGRGDSHRRPSYGLFVDGPNVLRDSIDLDLNDIRELVEERGTLRIARVYLNHRAPTRLIQASEAAGFAVRTTSGDVDVTLAVEATSAIERGTLDSLVIVSRDIDFKPVLELAAERGVSTTVIAPDGEGRSDGLVAAANERIILGG